MPRHSTYIYGEGGKIIGIACGTGPRRVRCKTCNELGAQLECDGCDRPLCGNCAVSPRKNVDFCQACFKPAFDWWKEHHPHSSERQARRGQFRLWARSNPDEFLTRSKPLTSAAKAAGGTP